MTGIIQFDFKGRPMTSYDSIAQASEKAGLGRSAISRCIRTGKPEQNTG